MSSPTTEVRPSLFFGLAPELRNRVYFFAIINEPVVDHLRKHSQDNVACFVYRNPKTEKYNRVPYKAVHPMTTQVNKQMRQETLAYFYNTRTIAFRDAVSASRFASTVDVTAVKAITSLEIDHCPDLSTVIKGEPQLRNDLSALSVFTGLRHLKISSFQIRIPKEVANEGQTAILAWIKDLPTTDVRLCNLDELGVLETLSISAQSSRSGGRATEFSHMVYQEEVQGAADRFRKVFMQGRKRLQGGTAKAVVGTKERKSV